MTLKIHVQPRSSQIRLIAWEGGWKLKITAPPVDGAANKEVCAFFAKALNIPKTAVQIAKGEKSKEKTLLIEGITESSALAALHKISA